MPRPKRTNFSQIPLFMLLIGAVIVVVSAFSDSSFLAILGVAIIFWATILLYVKPSKHVSLTLLNVSAEPVVANIERLILQLDLSERGVYLPPKNLRNCDSSLVFVPKTSKTSLPTSEQINEKNFYNEKTGAFVTPPGSSLSRLFEREQGFSFTKTNLKQVQNKLPKILIENLELAQNTEISIQGNTVIVEITGSVLDEICLQTNSQPRTHEQMGCLLSSAIACVLAKSAGKPVTIQSETRNQESKITKIEYRILEG
jgi:hypothetical protein